MHVMRIGVIDVGSNTTRLLVASAGPDGLVPLDKQKVRLSLGETTTAQDIQYVLAHLPPLLRPLLEEAAHPA